MKIIVFVFVVLIIISCSENTRNNTIVNYSPFLAIEYIESNSELELFNDAVELTGTKELFSSNDLNTFFLPTNLAINNFLKDNNYETLSDVPTDILNEIVSYPIIQNSILNNNFEDRYYQSNLYAENNIKYNLVIETGSNINNPKIVNNNSISTPDIEVTNGVIHILNNVLEVPTIYDIISYDDNLIRIKNAIHIADPIILEKIQSDEKFTFMVTNNEVFLLHLGTFEFEKITNRINDILNYNLLKGEILALEFNTVNNTELNQILFTNTDDKVLKIFNPYYLGTAQDTARLQAGNIVTKNGIIHFVNQVLEYQD